MVSAPVIDLMMPLDSGVAPLDTSMARRFVRLHNERRATEALQYIRAHIER